MIPHKILLFSAYSLLLTFLVSCSTLPKGAIVYLESANAKTNASAFWKKADKIPSTWEGRLLRADHSKINPVPEGDSLHSHLIDHQHRLTSGSSMEFTSPLGLKETVSSRDHQHLIASFKQTPNLTSEAPNMLPSIGMVTGIINTGMKNVPKGIIVGYLGSNIPKGWLLCDGTYGTPDLQGQYIRMERDKGNESRGNPTHSHRADHGHDWSTNQPDANIGTNIAFAGDIAPVSGPAFKAIGAHRHSVKELQKWEGSVDETAAVPPTILIRYIQAGPQAGRVPKGVVVPFLRSDIPDGWEVWNSSGSGNALFVRAALASEQVSTTLGTESHSHRFIHSHQLELSQSEEAHFPVRADGGPPVALSSHKHLALASDTLETSLAKHIPLCISVRFIIRK